MYKIFGKTGDDEWSEDIRIEQREENDRVVER